MSERPRLISVGVPVPSAARAAVVVAYRAGMSPRAIAAAEGVSLRTVYRIARQEQFPRQRSPIATTPASGRRRARQLFAPRACQECGADPDGRRIDRHHLDRDPTNNAPSNVAFLCVARHGRLHSIEWWAGRDGREAR